MCWESSARSVWGGGPDSFSHACTLRGASPDFALCGACASGGPSSRLNLCTGNRDAGVGLARGRGTGVVRRKVAGIVWSEGTGVSVESWARAFDLCDVECYGRRGGVVPSRCARVTVAMMPGQPPEPVVIGPAMSAVVALRMWCRAFAAHVVQSV